jgi:beta-glucosidase
MLTLHHFSDPLWFVRRGGWLNPAAPAIFRRFVEVAVDAFGDLVTLWITINEPMVYVRDGFLDGARPPGQRGLPNALRAARHLLLGHGQAYQVIHRRRSGAQVGIANHIAHFDPAAPAQPCWIGCSTAGSWRHRPAAQSHRPMDWARCRNRHWQTASIFWA